ncbi:MAG TPA: flagellar brake protein [Nitrospiraceae bacterium]|nr:flagellar brake protein [Nitrospiraceae bacterium]
MVDRGPLAHPAGSFLSVGLPLQLCFAEQQGSMQYGSSLIGWKAGDWLVCEWPYHLGQPVPCQVNDACLVRYMFDGRFIGYPSVIRDQQLRPFPFLFLAFPQSVEEVALRRHTRVSLKEPLLINIEETARSGRLSSQRVVGAMMHDLSLTGCCVTLPGRATWGPGTSLRLEFELRGIGHISNLSGVVKNLVEDPHHAEIGIEFLFTGMEFIEYRGWGGTVQKAIECCILQRSAL